MKVLFLTVRADLGGGPEHLYQLIGNLPSDFEAWVACPDDEPYRQRYEALIGPDRIIDIPHREFKVSAFRAVARLVRNEKIDVIHSHGKGAGLYGRLLAGMTRTRSVHTFHGLHIGEYGSVKKALYIWLERALGILTHRAICVSETEADAIGRIGLVPKGKLRIIPNGVEIPRSVHVTPLDGALNIVAVNRYDYQKNPDLIIDIAASLKGKRSFNMVVLGTGDRLEEMKCRVHSEGLEGHVQLLGGVPSARPFMREAHVFLSTSRWEGMPLAVLEAMSEGLCPVVTDVPGNRDIVSHLETGFLFKSSEEAFCALQSLSGSQYTDLCLKARDFVRDGYSVERMARDTFLTIRLSRKKSRNVVNRSEA